MTTTIIPIPTPVPMMIPIHTDDEPEICPSCHKKEQIKRVCAHCGYEYKDDSEPTSLKHNIIFALFLIALAGIPMWLIITFFQFMSYSQPTLVEVLYNQWLWFVNIFSRLW